MLSENEETSGLDERGRRKSVCLCVCIGTVGSDSMLLDFEERDAYEKSDPLVCDVICKWNDWGGMANGVGGMVQWLLVCGATNGKLDVDVKWLESWGKNVKNK